MAPKYFHSKWCQNILEYFNGSAPPTLYSWSYFSVGCSAPFYSWSASLIGSAYLFLYINFCLRFNKTLKNLTSLRQHLLHYSYLPALVSNMPCSIDFRRVTKTLWINFDLLDKKMGTPVLLNKISSFFNCFGLSNSQMRLRSGLL
jgi:hypothetical protein